MIDRTKSRLVYLVRPFEPVVYTGDSGQIDGTRGLATVRYGLPLMKDDCMAEFETFEDAEKFANENGLDYRHVHYEWIQVLHVDHTAPLTPHERLRRELKKHGLRVVDSEHHSPGGRRATSKLYEIIKGMKND